jgi:DNA-binding transcriptional ArsR family regulator
MELSEATAALSALAHEGRLEVFRRLVRAGAEGLAAGEIARATGMLPNTLSANLTILGHAGLVTSRRCGRSVIYAAAYGRMSALLAFLVEDCCGGASAICAPLAEITSRIACCAAPERAQP